MIRWFRRKPPAQDARTPPGPAPAPVPGTVSPHAEAQASPVLRAPAPGLYGRCVATANFHETGITVIYDHLLMRKFIDVPPLDEDQLREFLGESAP